MATAKYVIALLLLALSAPLFAGTPPVPPPPYGGADIRDTTITTKKIKATGITSGKVLTAGGGDTATWQTPSALALQNIQVYGDLSIYGHIREMQRGIRFDTSYVRCLRATQKINISIPDTMKVTCTDTFAVVHPGVAYFPGGYLGWKYWMVVTSREGTGCWEMSFLRVSNDAQNWVKVTTGNGFGGNAPDPGAYYNQFIDSSHGSAPDYYPADYNSDNDLILGSDGLLHWYIRATWAPTDTTSSAIYEMHSSNGYTWSTPKRITPIRAGDVGTGTPDVYISPTFWVDTGGTYKMWCISGVNGSNFASRKNRIELWQAPKADSGWAFVDTVMTTGTGVDFPSGSDTTTTADDSMWTAVYMPWHIKVMDNGADEKLAILTCVNFGTEDTAHNKYVEVLAVTPDDGRTCKAKFAPFLRPSTTTGLWDNRYVYRAAGWFENQGSNWALRFLYSSLDSTTGSGHWGIGLTEIDFLPYVDSLQIADGGVSKADHKNKSLDSTKYSNAGTAIENINWTREFLPLEVVYSMQSKAAADSMRLTFEQRPNASATPRWSWLSADSSGSAKNDTITMVATIPYNAIADTFIYRYLDSNAAGYITSVNVSVGSGALGIAADSSVTDSTTDKTSTTEVRELVKLGARNVNAGQQIVVTFVTTFGTTRYYWVKCTGAWVSYRRRQ